MDAALVVADRDGRIVHWNEHAERLFGHRADEVVGQPVDVEQAWGPVLDPLGAA